MFSAYTDDVFTFVSPRSDIAVVLMVLEWYENVKSFGLRLGAWKGVNLLGPFL